MAAKNRHGWLETITLRIGRSVVEVETKFIGCCSTGKSPIRTKSKVVN